MTGHSTNCSSTGVSCSKALDGIARETVNSLRHADPDIDEIEVYLAYQTRLRDTLELRHVAPDMRFLNISHVPRTTLPGPRGWCGNWRRRDSGTMWQRAGNLGKEW
ncbi:NEL-type E3 ubiquitin ligase domain-containing protein [Ensifer aridi]|nr:NEL-type E3 ubiquitin ligase domain-containing protein [Ensifer aridi]